MKAILFFLTFSLNAAIVFAQSDTAYKYLNKDIKKCAKEEAMYFEKAYKTNTGWQRDQFKLPQMTPVYTQVFSDSNFRTKEGLRQEYDSTGVLFSTEIYNENKIKSGKFYFANGNIAGTASYDAKGEVQKQKGWDSEGNEIKGYIFYKAPLYNKRTSFREFINENVDPNLPVRNGAAPGKYTVKVSFILDSTGTLQDIKALTAFGYGMEEELISALKNSSGKWQPAIVNNKMVTQQFTQPLTFMVQENKNSNGINSNSGFQKKRNAF